MGCGAEDDEGVVVRSFPTGEIIEEHEGMLMRMPDGQCWLIC